jgi:glutaredoxin
MSIKFKIDFPYPSQHNEDITVYIIEGCPHCEATMKKLETMIKNCTSLCIKVAVYTVELCNGKSKSGCITRTDMELLRTTIEKNDTSVYTYSNSPDTYMTEETYKKLLKHKSFPYIFVKSKSNELVLYDNEEFQHHR